MIWDQLTNSFSIASDTRFDLEALALPDESPDQLSALRQEFLAEYRPTTPGEHALIDQMLVARLDLGRTLRVKASLLGQQVRDAVRHYDNHIENVLAAAEALFRSNPPEGVRQYKRVAAGVRCLIQKWTFLKQRLDQEGTLYGNDSYILIRLMGHSPVPTDLIRSDEAYLAWIYCLWAQPNPDRFDIELTELPQVRPKRFQDLPPESWLPAPEECRARLRAIVEGALPPLHALEERLRLTDEIPDRESARLQACALSSQDPKAMLLQREIQMHERSFQRAYDAFLKGRRIRTRTDPPSQAAAAWPLPTLTRREPAEVGLDHPREGEAPSEPLPAPPQVAGSDGASPSPNDRQGAAPAQPPPPRPSNGTLGVLLLLAALLVPSLRLGGGLAAAPLTSKRPENVSTERTILMADETEEKPRSKISEAKLRSNRANALLSTGPVTTEGINTSKFNNLSHGMTATLPVVLETEDPEEYKRFIAGYVAALNPQNEAELAAAEAAANSAWRLRRCEAIEKSLTEERMDTVVEQADDRLEIEAARHAENLPADPLGARFALRGTTYGCQWMINQLLLLKHAITVLGGLEPSQVTRLLNLCGKRLDLSSDQLVQDLTRAHLAVVYQGTVPELYTVAEHINYFCPPTMNPNEFLHHVDNLRSTLPSPGQGRETLLAQIESLLADLKGRRATAQLCQDRALGRRLDEAAIDGSTAGKNRQQYTSTQLRNMKTAHAELQRLQRMRREQIEAGEAPARDQKAGSKDEATAARDQKAGSKDEATAKGTSGSSEFTEPAPMEPVAGLKEHVGVARAVAPHRRE